MIRGDPVMLSGFTLILRVYTTSLPRELLPTVASRNIKNYVSSEYGQMFCSSDRRCVVIILWYKSYYSSSIIHYKTSLTYCYWNGLLTAMLYYSDVYAYKLVYRS